MSLYRGIKKKKWKVKGSIQPNHKMIYSLDLKSGERKIYKAKALEKTSK